MKCIFWTFSDDSIIEFIKLNSSMKSLSKIYPFIFLTSGIKSKSEIEKDYGGEIIICENDMQKKAQELFRSVASRDYDALVKIDLDAIIFKIDDLINLISFNLKNDSMIGNLRVETNYITPHGKRIEKINYIRGGCNAVHRTLIDKIDFIYDSDYGKMDFDFPFNKRVVEVGGSLIDFPLFEISVKYSGILPVWHPNKSGNKLSQFKVNINEYEKCRGKWK